MTDTAQPTGHSLICPVPSRTPRRPPTQASRAASPPGDAGTPQPRSPAAAAEPPPPLAGYEPPSLLAGRQRRGSGAWPCLRWLGLGWPLPPLASGPPALSHALPPGGRSRVAGGCRSLGSGAGRRPLVGPLRWRLGAGRAALPSAAWPCAPASGGSRGSGGRRRRSPRGRQRSRVCCPADAPSSSNIADTNKRNKRGPISALEKAWALEDRKHLDALISRAISRVIN